MAAGALMSECDFARAANLAMAPIEVLGEWSAPKPAVATIVAFIQSVCFSDVRLLSDRQPRKIIVENRPAGPPAIWLHAVPADAAWMYVDIGVRAWSQLAYQLGHEFGHVLCNSWAENARPRRPCQWVEEALAETFSLRGLGRLAQRWRLAPPFRGDSVYGAAIEEYLHNAIGECSTLATRQRLKVEKIWFQENRPHIEDDNGLSEYAKAIVPILLSEVEKRPILLEDCGALNRWSQRTALPLPEYLDSWSQSCQEIGAHGLLPAFFRDKFIPDH